MLADPLAQLVYDSTSRRLVEIEHQPFPKWLTSETSDCHFENPDVFRRD
jgi:hypothetical protein